MGFVWDQRIWGIWLMYPWLSSQFRQDPWPFPPHIAAVLRNSDRQWLCTPSSVTVYSITYSTNALWIIGNQPRLITYATLIGVNTHCLITYAYECWHDLCNAEALLSVHSSKHSASDQTLERNSWQLNFNSFYKYAHVDVYGCVSVCTSRDMHGVWME